MAETSGIVRVEVVGLDKVGRAFRDIAALGKQGAVARIGTNLTSPPYPFFLEYGTSRMPAYPTARPAFDEGWPEAQRVTSAVLGQLIRAGRRDPDVLRLAVEAGALPLSNGWKRRVQRGPVPAHMRRGTEVVNLSDTGTYARSIHVTASLVDDAGQEVRR